ncbi:alpha/beta fold hydrolase [Actinomycetospora flava]|uniref:Alpha/beta hydrolase n=1 Tax=Actinomycetospora flava TaxID=3129232 RepID=A0ABU8LZC7_9PSEU
MPPVRSRDGTPIASRRSGDGPPLVLVHGTASDHSRWAPVLPALEQRWSVHAVDRRGRGSSGDSGDSGDAATYAPEREFEDVTAVADALGEPVTVFGHSYGALCTLEAARLSHSIATLILYEPSFDTDGAEVYPLEVVERLETLLLAGDRDEVVATTAREVAGVPPDAVAAFRRSQPTAWRARTAAAHTIPRELRAAKTYRFDPERFRDLAVPTLLLAGSESPRAYRRATEAVDGALPGSRIVVLPGQGHTAMDTAPDLVTSEVIRFLGARS